MKRQYLLLMAALVFFGALNAQNPVYEYSYDAAGNRILRAVVPLHKGDGSLHIDSPYQNPRKPSSNKTAFPTSGTFHWTDVPIAVVSLELLLILLSL